MYANNRRGLTKKASFRTAGGTIYQFSHPFLTGHVNDVSGVNILNSDGNTVDVSSSLRLNDTFFNAQPLQDNAIMEVLVDGSTITVTNHIMAGRATLQVLPTTGLVKDGDLTAIAPFIMSAKDNVGGVLVRRRFVTEGALTRVYYGVTFANFPHDIDIGNGVPVYPITMLYSGWFEGLNVANEATERVLWAVGNARGYSGTYQPFPINSTDDRAGTGNSVSDAMGAGSDIAAQTPEELTGDSYNYGTELTPVGPES